ncbi:MULTISPECIES: CaiB/BaiF CoA transferase family protein [Rhodococcus]|uniref:Putative alpha-methylacyl-CoA racemase n=1 Tax=Rhodococcus opacus RKJ300 = JCM 13270 TaxID=1165867 RepID=I0WP98_RHOOP|nr:MULTISPECIES: CaiB/BaiF CoA-transferase family protein [Rhodococcus]EID78214.1 putative alpha-methylacyl-CoA racemase [Rhodococcus opacus RKJ300 = JCM 13270]QQZ14404.1 CoA transferase [Rhodococcus sp. 21391]
MTGPLAGVRVVELARIGPVPHAAMVLGDLGADVVRVDRPDSGASLYDRAEDHLFRNRRAVLADLKDAADLRRVRQLIDRADVVLEGFRPGVVERLGLGPEQCMATHSRLVFGRMTGWGQTGPSKDGAGHDINYISLTGALHAIGRPGQPPAVPLSLVGDFGGGSMLLVTGVLAALVERSVSGRGQVIDAAMVDGASLLMQPVWGMFGAGFWQDERGTNFLDGASPFYRTYECADGKFVAVGALEPQFYAALLRGLGLEGDDLPAQHDRRSWPQLSERFAVIFAGHSRDHWGAVFAGTDACVTPVLSLREAAQNQHLRDRQTLIDVEGVVQAAPAPRFSRTPPGAPRPPRSYQSIDEIARSWAQLVRNPR